MECREVRRLSDAFVSEQLLVETTQAVIAHLDGCPACRAEIDGLRRLRAATQAAFLGAPGLAARPEFLAALASRLQLEAERPSTAQSSSRRWMALAAGVLLVIGVGFGIRGWSSGRLSDLARAAVGDHQNCALTFKLTEAPIPLEEAALRYGGIYGPLEKVEPATATLSGGPVQIVARHSCVFRGRRFAHIVLRYKNEAVSLLVADDPRPVGDLLGGPPADGTTASLPTTDGFQVSSFQGSRHIVFVVSSLNDRDVQEVAQAMVGPVSAALTGV